MISSIYDCPFSVRRLLLGNSHNRDYNFSQFYLKLGQNICTDDVQVQFEHGPGSVNSRSLCQISKSLLTFKKPQP